MDKVVETTRISSASTAPRSARKMEMNQSAAKMKSKVWLSVPLVSNSIRHQTLMVCPHPPSLRVKMES